MGFDFARDVELSADDKIAAEDGHRQNARLFSSGQDTAAVAMLEEVLRLDPTRAEAF